MKPRLAWSRPGRNTLRNKRKQVWVCGQCQLWAHEKVKACAGCGNKKLHYFPSCAEATRYAQLRLMQEHGLISGLELQPVFDVEINGLHVCKYRADYRYKTKDGLTVTEDVKGWADELYLLKKRLVEAYYNITISEVKA